MDLAGINFRIVKFYCNALLMFKRMPQMGLHWADTDLAAEQEHEAEEGVGE